MISKQVTIMVFSVALLAAAPALGAGETVVVAKDELKWKDMGGPGVAAAQVDGDMEKGPSRFFLKYPVGLVTPVHHHTADHYVTVTSGSMTLTVEGREYKLGPGSYFALTGKASHIAKVEGNEPAVMFIQADGPWDAVMEK